MEIFEYKVDSETENMRMDRYLKKNYPDEPLSKIFQALRKGDVRVNDKKVKENYRLSLEDKITIKYLGNGKTPSKKTNSPKNKFSFDEKKYREMVIFENEDFAGVILAIIFIVFTLVKIATLILGILSLIYYKDDKRISMAPSILLIVGSVVGLIPFLGWIGGIVIVTGGTLFLTSLKQFQVQE